MKFPALNIILMIAIPAVSLIGADLQPLLDNSPFGRAPAPESTVVPPNEALLEFRSLVVEGGQRYFSIFDPSSQRGYWVAEGEEAGGISVADYNEENQQLEVHQDGRTLNLIIKTANIIAGAAPQPVVPVPSRIRAPQVKATSAADTKRLEAVAAEVRRRRALRQAATNGTTH